MAEDQMLEQPKPSKKSEPAVVTMTVEQITNLVTAAVTASEKRSSDATADALKALAVAIQDSRKPYKDPRSEYNDQMMRDQMRETNLRIAKNIAASQASCPHMQGSNELSDFQGQLTSIVKHYTDTGVAWGICTNCLRQFWPGQPDYMVWMAKKSGNRPSAAGRRWFEDPAGAAEASMPKKEERAAQPASLVSA